MWTALGVYTHGWFTGPGSTCRRLFCKAEVWSERAHVCRWSTDRINTSKVEIKPQQSETLTHFHLSVHPILTRHRADQAPSQRTSLDFWSAWPTLTQTHTRWGTYTQVSTLSITKLHTQFPDPLQAAGFRQPPIYCELPPVWSETHRETLLVILPTSPHL